MKKSVFSLRFSVWCCQSITLLLLLIAYCILVASCSVTKQISKHAKATLLNDSAVNTGHIGISIYDPAANKYLYNHNAAQYFIPASNAKLFTLYAGMKYLGDSLIGGYFQNFSDTAINFIATGDPTFLHPDFKSQPVLDFFKKEKRKIYVSGSYNDEALGYGWAWDDYNDDYMAERNIFPVYGNVAHIRVDNYTEEKHSVYPNWETTSGYFKSLLPNITFVDSKTFSKHFLDSKLKIGVKDTINLKAKAKKFEIVRSRTSNTFSINTSNKDFKNQEIPFFTNEVNTTVEILKKDFNLNMVIGGLGDNTLYPGIAENLQLHSIKSQPSDSLFKLMMHRSDNFFAEQTLIMASKRGWNNLADKNETLVLIDTVLKLHLPNLSQCPKWVDGSGLSRYNLFTPQSFVQILHQLKLEFGLTRLQTILPTGGEGTLSSYYKKYAGNIFAKTGTLSNNCALSGYLITKKGKLLIFSILNNNYITGATPIRKAVEKFLGEIIEKY